MITESQNLKREHQILAHLGYSQATSIQEKAMPVLLEGKSLVALAPTGSGKTFAFLIPLMLGLSLEQSAIQLLILVPTRELGAQIAAEAEKVASFFKGEEFKRPQIRRAFGGQRTLTQKQEILKKPHILIATPGRLLELLNTQVLDLQSLKAFVLDEADLMLHMGFEEQLHAICEYIPLHVQSALFSATPIKMRSRLQERFTTGDVENRISESFLLEKESFLAEKNHQIKHQYIEISHENSKDEELLSFLNQSQIEGQALIFCQTREKVHALCEFLKSHRIQAEALAGDLGQIERSTILRRFKAGGVKLLVATNLASRGIDIKDLSLVIHYDLPSTFEEYVHRSGRSGRSGKKGWSLSLCGIQHLNFYHDLLTSLEVTPDIYTPQKRGSQKETIPKDNTEYLSAKSSQTFAKVHLNKGKSSKIRPGDIVGYLVKQVGFQDHEVGNIFIFDHFSHVEVHPKYLSKLKNASLRIKNMSAKFSVAQG